MVRRRLANCLGSIGRRAAAGVLRPDDVDAAVSAAVSAFRCGRFDAPPSAEQRAKAKARRIADRQVPSVTYHILHNDYVVAAGGTPSSRARTASYRAREWLGGDERRGAREAHNAAQRARHTDVVPAARVAARPAGPTSVGAQVVSPLRPPGVWTWTDALVATPLIGDVYADRHAAGSDRVLDISPAVGPLHVAAALPHCMQIAPGCLSAGAAVFMPSAAFHGTAATESNGVVMRGAGGPNAVPGDTMWVEPKSFVLTAPPPHDAIVEACDDELPSPREPLTMLQTPPSAQRQRPPPGAFAHIDVDYESMVLELEADDVQAGRPALPPWIPAPFAASTVVWDLAAAIRTPVGHDATSDDVEPAGAVLLSSTVETNLNADSEGDRQLPGPPNQNSGQVLIAASVGASEADISDNAGVGTLSEGGTVTLAAEGSAAVASDDIAVTRTAESSTAAISALITVPEGVEVFTAAANLDVGIDSTMATPQAAPRATPQAAAAPAQAAPEECDDGNDGATPRRRRAVLAGRRPSVAFPYGLCQRGRRGVAFASHNPRVALRILEFLWDPGGWTLNPFFGANASR